MRHYFDHASTSPCRPQVQQAMQAALVHFGDSSRGYQEALQVRLLIEEAREKVAFFFGATPRSVVFTSGATEAITTVIQSAAGRSAHQVSTTLEHSAVNKCLERLPAVQISKVGADKMGLVDPQALLAAVNPETSLVHLQLCNHEIGTCQAVTEVAEACRAMKVRLHSDAAQAAAHMSFSFEELGADFMSVSAHKMGGPPGVGALLVRQGLRVEPLFLGGDQERARRAGLENFIAIAGFGAACQFLSEANSTQTNLEITQQRAFTKQISKSLASIEGVELLGHPASQASHISCFYIADIEPQAVVIELDKLGFAVHSGSACSSEADEPSAVLEAIGLDGHHSLRISVGWNTTQASVDALLEAVPKVLAELRSLKQRG